MTNYQGSQDCDPINRSSSESCTLHLPQITEPVSVQKFLDRLMQHQVDPVQIGRQICQILTTSSDQETLLQIVANILGAACQADYCLVTAVTDSQIAIPNASWGILGDRTNSTVVSDLTTGLTQTTISNSPLIAIEHPLLVNVLADGEMVAIADTQDCETTNAPNSPAIPMPFRAILASPVRFGGAINGMIILGKLQPHEWSATSRQCLELVSGAIGSAISHIQKNQEIVNLNQQLKRQAKYKNLLSSIAKEINTNSEIDLILQQVMQSTANTLEVDRIQILQLKYIEPPFNTSSPNQTLKAKIALIGEYRQKEYERKPTISQSEVGQINPLSKTKKLDKTPPSKSKITGSKSHNSASHNSAEFWMSESSLCQSAFNIAPKSFVLTDTGKVINKEQQHLVEILKLQDTRTLVLVPLVSAQTQENVLGFLVLQQSKPRTWQAEELEILELIATQVTSAMLQLQTLKQVQTLLEDRSAQLEQSLDVQVTLHEQSANQLEQIRKLKLIQDEFLSVVSHELRTPLTIMKLAIMMLKQAEELLPSRIKYLEILEQQCSKEIDLINDLLELKQFDTPQVPMSLLPIDLNYLIQDLAGDFEEKWANKGLTVVIDLTKPLPHLESDKDSLHRILLELLTNAGKYSASGTTVVLEVSQADNNIVLKLSNFGSGISPVDLPHIFEKFRRGTGVTQQAIPGTGLGLTLVKCLVQRLNGTIEVCSCPSEMIENHPLWRTSFTLTLPQQFPRELCSLES